ncbi:hypothetical protein ACFL0M_05840 [Thermodesulfobacteriota bacterium]
MTYEDVGGLSKEIRMIQELVKAPLCFPQVYAHLGFDYKPKGFDDEQMELFGSQIDFWIDEHGNSLTK